MEKPGTKVGEPKWLPSLAERAQGQWVLRTGARKWDELGHDPLLLSHACVRQAKWLGLQVCGHDTSRCITFKNSAKRARSPELYNCKPRKSKQMSTLIYFISTIHLWLQILGHSHSLPEPEVSRREQRPLVPWLWTHTDLRHPHPPLTAANSPSHPAPHSGNSPIS